ncbi:transmembrane 9 superfamily member 2-like isoform X2 [Paramuricea clavata]|uniref:Transmembrane 9 superfamily member n=1 Tax=Paramuricea clavata TaxID=317549 RepID=A0A6S7HB89_PARCT|nr:transmembrane 9 superfamily member 2-like isoform X2 [Paramuricea clavata]
MADEQLTAENFAFAKRSSSRYSTFSERFQEIPPKSQLSVKTIRLSENSFVHDFSGFSDPERKLSYAREMAHSVSDEEIYGRYVVVVFGERIQPSAYNITFKHDKCDTACKKKYTKETVTGEKLNFIKNGIRLNYQHHWIIDNMPVTWCYQVSTTDARNIYCSTGFPIGCYVDSAGTAMDTCVIQPKIYNEKDTYYIFNHVRITLNYHNGVGEDWDGARLVSAQLWPSSCKDACKDPSCSQPFGIKAGGTEPITIPYTYQVLFMVSSS